MGTKRSAATFFGTVDCSTGSFIKLGTLGVDFWIQNRNFGTNAVF